MRLRSSDWRKKPTGIKQLTRVRLRSSDWRKNHAGIKQLTRVRLRSSDWRKKPRRHKAALERMRG